MQSGMLRRCELESKFFGSREGTLLGLQLPECGPIPFRSRATGTQRCKPALACASTSDYRPLTVGEPVNICLPLGLTCVQVGEAEGVETESGFVGSGVRQYDGIARGTC
jgi:hypothetical protein